MGEASDTNQILQYLKLLFIDVLPRVHLDYDLDLFSLVVCQVHLAEAALVEFSKQYESPIDFVNLAFLLILFAFIFTLHPLLDAIIIIDVFINLEP